MSTSAAKDPAVVVGDVRLTECINGDCEIALTGWKAIGAGHKTCVTEVIPIPKANRNAIAEFLKV